MKYVASFGRFWYEFLVGEDWTIAVAAVVAVALAVVLADVTDAAWIVMPIAVAVILSVSVWRAARAHRQRV